MLFFGLIILLQIPMPNTNQNCVSISAKVVRRRFQVPPPKSNEKPVFSHILACQSNTKKSLNFFFKIIKAEAFLNMLLENQCRISLLSVVFWWLYQHALYFMRALYFVRCWASVVAKSQLHNEFSQNIFPITPHGNGNIGSDSRQLPEFGFNVGEISPVPQ